MSYKTKFVKILLYKVKIIKKIIIEIPLNVKAKETKTV